MIRRLAVIALALMVASCSSTPSTAPAESGAAEKPALKAAPDFDLVSVANTAGASLKSEDLKGRVTILDFWATWCQPCITEIPHYNELSEKFKDQPVTMLGVTIESGSLEDVQPFIEKFQMKYPVVMGTEEVVTGFGGLIGFPTTFVVDKEGKIYQKYLGVKANKKELLEQDIHKLLAQ